MLQHYWNLTIRLFSVISGHLLGEGSYPSAEVQSVYSTAPATWETQYRYTNANIGPWQVGTRLYIVPRTDQPNTDIQGGTIKLSP